MAASNWEYASLYDMTVIFLVMPELSAYVPTSPLVALRETPKSNVNSPEMLSIGRIERRRQLELEIVDALAAWNVLCGRLLDWISAPTGITVPS